MNTIGTALDPSHSERDLDQRIVLDGISWAQYVALRRADDSPGLRMTYLGGALEIMSPSTLHEDIKKRIARLLETWAVERGVELSGYGSTTYRSRAKEIGLEPDECYCLGESQKARPDIAIEVNVSSGGVDKLEVYRGLGVPEVWVWARGNLVVHRLGRRGYSSHKTSALLPNLDVALLGTFAAMSTSQTKAVIAYRDVIRARG